MSTGTGSAPRRVALPTPSTIGSLFGSINQTAQYGVKSKNIKVAKPDFYEGERGKLNTQLNQIELYLKFSTDIRLEDKGLVVASFLRGRIEYQIRLAITAYFDDDYDNE